MHAARGGPSCRTGALWLAPIPPTKLHADGAARRANHAHRAIDGCDRTSQTAGRLAIKRRTDTTCNTTSLSRPSAPSPRRRAELTSRSWGDAGAFDCILHPTSQTTYYNCDDCASPESSGDHSHAHTLSLSVPCFPRHVARVIATHSSPKTRQDSRHDSSPHTKLYTHTHKSLAIHPSPSHSLSACMPSLCFASHPLLNSHAPHPSHHSHNNQTEHHTPEPCPHTSSLLACHARPHHTPHTMPIVVCLPAGHSLSQSKNDRIACIRRPHARQCIIHLCCR